MRILKQFDPRWLNRTYCFFRDVACSLVVVFLVGLVLGCQSESSESIRKNIAENPPERISHQRYGDPDSTKLNQEKEAATLIQTSDDPGQTSLKTDSHGLTMNLFDGTSLNDWEVTPFGGQGECFVEDGKIILEPGFPLTGITSTRTGLPTTNYEILVEARKTDGIDFFCGLTFPVDDTHCSLIVGGWAGSVVGLSMIDNLDAANNETKRLMKFQRNQWYTIKVRVTPKRIEAWIDNEQVIDQDITNRQISVRNETLPSRPLGICSFETRSEIRRIDLNPKVPDSPQKTNETR